MKLKFETLSFIVNSCTAISHCKIRKHKFPDIGILLIPFSHTEANSNEKLSPKSKTDQVGRQWIWQAQSSVICHMSQDLQYECYKEARWCDMRIRLKKLSLDLKMFYLV